MADDLHDKSTVDDELWSLLDAEFTAAALLDLFLLCGRYHAVCFAANAAAVALEVDAPRFVDVLDTPSLAVQLTTTGEVDEP